MKTKASLWIAVFSTVGALAAAPGTLAAEKDGMSKDKSGMMKDDMKDKGVQYERRQDEEGRQNENG
jgi:hypothetical protein